MSITDELRECIATAVWQYENDVKTAYIPKDRLLAIANRIDEWNKADVCCEYTRGYTAGYNEASDGIESADELRERIEREYIKAPVDADGAPIRIGDRVRIGRTEFEAIGFGNVTCDEETYGVFMQRESGEYEWFNARYLRHIQPDSWERILDDAVRLSRGDNDAVMELVERCRRLAGE